MQLEADTLKEALMGVVSGGLPFFTGGSANNDLTWVSKELAGLEERLRSTESRYKSLVRQREGILERWE